MASRRFGDSQFNSLPFNQAGAAPEPPTPPETGLSLFSGGNDWTDRTDWKQFKLTFRAGIGVAATFALDTTDVIEIAPGCDDRFTLTLPTGEIFVLVPTGEPKTLYRQDAHDINLKDTVHTYETIDVVSALDRVPLPAHQFIESTAGEIISTLVAALDATLDTGGVATGNDVPYLNTEDFVKFSDVIHQAAIQTGSYQVQIDPNVNSGLAVKADYKSNFGNSGVAVDKDEVYVEGVSVDFTPQKELIEPDNNIINLQRVKSSKPGPHHTVMEFRGIDALSSSFKLKTEPYGLDGTELINFQVDGGDVSTADGSELPKIVPLHYPVQIEISDITLGGTGELFGFIGRGDITVLSLLTGSGSIGAKVAGVSHTQSVPFASGAAPDLDHQYFYDFHAFWSTDQLEVDIVENYLDNGADPPTVTVTERRIYSGPAPSNRYGKPQLVISGGAGVKARSWAASYGPAIDAILLSDGGRRLRVDTVASSNTDMVISKSGNSAICTFVGERLPLRGYLEFLLNYDAAKIVDVTVQDIPAQARCGIRQGDPITSDAVLTAAEAMLVGQAVLDEFADPRPKGTITREHPLTTRMPLPNEKVPVDVPTEYMLDVTTDSPISDVSIDFGGWDWTTNDGVLIYHISIGNLDAVEAVNRDLLAAQVFAGVEFRPLSAPGPRITSASWDDIDTVTLGITGSITLNGQPSSNSFDPAQFATSALREGPVSVSGTVDDGVNPIAELQVEVIYPPLGVDPDSETCDYSPLTNKITYKWDRPEGAQFYRIQRKLDDGTHTGVYTYQQIDEILNEEYQLSYEPASKSIKITTIGLADKENLSGPVELECTLPTMPPPTTFVISPDKRVKPSGRIPFLISAPPTGEFLHRAEGLVILLTKTPVNTPPTLRSDFVGTDTNLVRTEIPQLGISTATRQPVYYEEFEPGESVWAVAFYKDKFGDEGAITVPFDVLHPPVTVGSVTPVDFFQSASQVNGGAIEDDNELTPQLDYSGKFRVHLGQHNSSLKLYFEESDPISAGGTYNPDNVFTSHDFDINDTDVINGYVDVFCKQRFRESKKKKRKYRLITVVFFGPNLRSRPDITGEPQQAHEKRYLEGYLGIPPPLVDHVIDGVFDRSLFEFQPGINGLANNFTVVTGVSLVPKPEALKTKWNRFADDASLRRYFVVLSTVPFGTLGPGTDVNIATDLNAIETSGTILVYNPTNTTRNISVGVLDAGDVGHHTFQNGDVIGPVTVTFGVTYYAAVIAQIQNGRYSTAFSTVVSSTGGGISGGEDTGDAGSVQNLLMLPWSSKKGWRETHQPPLTNYTAPRGYAVSYYFNNGSSTFWMNPETGALLATVAGAVAGDERNAANTGGIQVFIKIDDTRHTTGIAANDPALDPVFKNNGVKGRVRAINRQSAGDTISGNFVETSVVVPGSDSTTPVPGTLVFPASLATNTMDGDPEKNLARIVVPISTVSGTFSANNVKEVSITYFRRDSAGNLVGSALTEIWQLGVAEAAVTGTSRELFLKPGQNFRIVAITSINADKSLEVNGTLNFTSGGITHVDPSDAQVVPAPTFGTITREDGSNKIDLVPISLVQTGGVGIWFKKLIVEANMNSAGWATEVEIGLKSEDALSVIGGSYSKTLRIKRKAGVTAQYRVTSVAVGGKQSATTTSTLQGVTAADLSADTGAPNNGTALTLDRAKFKNGALLLNYLLPTAQMVTHWKTVLIMRDGAGATGSNYDPFTTTWVTTYPDGTQELQIGKGGVQGLGIFKSQVFTGGRTSFFVRIGVYNQFNGGTATYSNVLEVLQTNSENESPSDQVSPGTPPAPVVKEFYGDITVKAHPPTTGSNVIIKWQMAMTDVNTTPTNSDPPLAGGGTIFDFQEGGDGFAKWRVVNIIGTRYFWVRCMNANNPTVWSSWSGSTSVTGTGRPLTDVIGDGVITVPTTTDTTFADGFLDNQLSISAGIKCPFRIRLDADSFEDVVEILPPDGPNALSATHINVQITKSNAAATLKYDDIIKLTDSPVYRFVAPDAAFGAYTPAIRVRYRNQFRTAGSDGWSAWSVFGKGLRLNEGAPVYNPGVEPPVVGDQYDEDNYPSRYLVA